MVWHPQNFGSALRFFLLILHNKRDQEVHENSIGCFFEKKSHLGTFDIFRSFLIFDWVWSKLRQVTVTIGSLNS